MQPDVHYSPIEIWFEKRVRNHAHTTLRLSPRQRQPPRSVLALHATCAKVAQFSGAAKYIDKQDRVMEDLGVLAEDGSSAEALSSALLKSMNQPILRLG
ncbi:hypothetical protein EV421DRAFT_1221034 [Armillaria borealis]|uniref:Uncharacterized protein n=1 Tax=Armillaria borealis TaxID=47425 RepID=A0AA39J6D2_9AGAR|nr:hypothetical protein EV421DRAFT_1221034 [Armillaria borealis]